MTEPIIDLDAILKPYEEEIYAGAGGYKTIVSSEDAKQAMLQACKECLRVASEKAEADTEFYGWGKETQLDATEYSSIVNKQSILNVEKLIKL